ncbi:conserved hypothetical protein [Uncinocarpus reesii 1704]|uniref:Cdc23 domain-containing protein n=1 Tax=Uncinocarpus reesii (strain UAMH 1704) TaxID=336963 RepID=C4JMA6_UNCRE|nr:uncharacterized protein UREG_03964 [Uncinocarpus reesii 1704]EEP79118.1 conserved hypothetical protein [Uncinocarpus reesii 1704]
MLNSLVPIDNDDADTEPDSPMDFSPSAIENPFLSNSDPDDSALEAKEAHKYILAKSYFDTREYDRCAAVFLPPSMSAIPLALQSSTSTSKIKSPLASRKGKEKSVSFGKGRATSKNPFPPLSQKSLFLALYAKYLAGEKRKDEETEMILGPVDGGMTVNRELHALAQGLEGWFADRREQGLESRGQGWLEYLYGVILLKAKNEEEAKKWLIKSVHLYPFHWGAWQELNDLLTNTDDVYFEEASHLFSELLISYPHRLDGLDHYSNILYVMGARPQLAFVAQLATATDKFRPETCCVVGNYYSMESEHEKAVMYFDPSYEVLDMAFYALSTTNEAAALRPYDPKMWQAVGSCYAKMGRADQSIRALKRALVAGSYYDSSGTGMNSFASGGVGISFPPGGPGHTPSALRILDPETLHQIATLYERLGDEEEAAAYMELTLQQETGQMGRSDDYDDDTATDADGISRRTSTLTHQNDDLEDEPTGTGVTATTSKARLWLARWALRHHDLDRADQLASELCQDGVEVEEAKALMRDIRARREGDG